MVWLNKREQKKPVKDRLLDWIDRNIVYAEKRNLAAFIIICNLITLIGTCINLAIFVRLLKQG